MLPMGKTFRNGLRSVRTDAAEADVVLIVSVAVTEEGVLVIGGVETEQVGRSAAPIGPETVHESITLLLKPPLGVMVIVEVPLAPGDAMLTGVLLSVKL